eukprot:1568121-Amphidinium_carterae.2
MCLWALMLKCSPDLSTARSTINPVIVSFVRSSYSSIDVASVKHSNWLILARVSLSPTSPFSASCNDGDRRLVLL